MDTEFLEECSSLLPPGTQSENQDLTIIDLKDHLRQTGYAGDFECPNSIKRYLRAEYFINLETEKSEKVKENQVYVRLLKSLKMGLPPKNLSSDQFFAGVVAKIKKSVMEEINEQDINKFLGGRSMTPDNLNPNQLDATIRLIDHLNTEYLNRMKVLLRVDIMKNRVWNSYLCNWKTGPKKVF